MRENPRSSEGRGRSILALPVSPLFRGRIGDAEAGSALPGSASEVHGQGRTAGIRDALEGCVRYRVVGAIPGNLKTGRGAEIGRQAALRAQCSKGRVGSNPTLGTRLTQSGECATRWSDPLRPTLAGRAPEWI